MSSGIEISYHLVHIFLNPTPSRFVEGSIEAIRARGSRVPHMWNNGMNFFNIRNRISVPESVVISEMVVRAAPMLHHTCLAKEQETTIWSMDSATWSQRKQNSFACGPCLRPRSTVQCHRRSASHRNNLTCNGSQVFQIRLHSGIGCEARWRAAYVICWSHRELPIRSPPPDQSSVLCVGHNYTIDLWSICFCNKSTN